MRESIDVRPAGTRRREVKPLGRRALSFVLVCLLLLGALAGAVVCAEETEEDKGIAASRQQLYSAADLLRLKIPEFDVKQQEWEKKGYKPVEEGIEVVIPAADFAAHSGEGISVASGVGGRDGKVLVQDKDESWVDYEFTVPKSGIYEIEAEFYPPEGDTAPSRRAIMIDGEWPFLEARRLSFERLWRDERDEPEKDNQGNDMRPGQLQVFAWQRKPLQDAEGMYTIPFRFYLPEGKHTLRFIQTRGPLVVGSFTVRSPEILVPYEEKLAEWKEKGYKEVSDVVVKVQAEKPALKSDLTIRREFGSDPLSEPPHEGKFRLNEFGGWRWRIAGQWVEWKITVPKSGLYRISVRNWQGYNRMPVPREIRIDGEIPFEEARRLFFVYDRQWKMTHLGEYQSDEPYLFYLDKGEHTIRLTARLGAVARTLRTIDGLQREMSVLTREIVMLTGSNPDPNMRWELDKQLPHLIPTLEGFIKQLEDESAYLEAFAEERPQVVNAFIMAIEQMKSMIRKPDTIPTRLEQFSNTQATLSSWSLALRDNPLTLDYIIVHSPDAELPRARSTFFERLGLATFNFLASFYKDYESVGSKYEIGETDETVLQIWASMGRDWVRIVKEMTEDSFTPKSGIKVNLMILPAGQMQALLLASVAGKAPDAVIGAPALYPVEFAIREAVVDLTNFPGYEEVTKRFRPGALIPYHYQGGNYALPETQDFGMLFYRTDILGDLGLTPPQTWDDVYDIIPRLQQNGLDFFYGNEAGATVQMQGRAAGYTPFLFQLGGNYYTEDGYRSALDTPEALAAFKEWTWLYTHYKIPAAANFYNRMRIGDIPIGVSKYGTYVLLSTAAPELTGWWEMLPMPGHVNEEGVIDRSTGGVGTVSMIMRDSKRREEAWEFVKWWTSEDPQSRFGSELQALIGPEARWNTANVKALQSLPWPAKDISHIIEQWQWFKEMPIVLGGYFTSRHVMNAWNRVVLQGWNPRDALEEAVKDINRELRKKQEEFGIYVDPVTGEVTHGRSGKLGGRE